MSSKLFVGYLPYTMTSEDLKETFGPFGPVVSAKVITDRETGRSRGFGFVELQTPDACQRAVRELNGADLGGRAATVRVAEDRPPGGGGGGGGGGRGMGGGGGDRGGPRAPRW